MTATIKTVTAVDTGTEELTATAHGLLTGDPFRLRNDGGALPAATPSLASATTYYAIKTTNDKIKVATSSANALAGTAVNLTGAGTGTHYIEYGLPYCERRTATAGSQIFSIDDNEAWAALTALRALETGAAQSIWTGGHGDRVLNLPGVACVSSTNANITYNISTGQVNATGAITLLCEIPLRAGDRIKSITFARLGDGAVDVTAADVVVTQPNSAAGSIGNTSITNVAAAWTDTTIDVTDTILPTGWVFFLAVTVNATGFSMNNIRVTYDRP